MYCPTASALVESGTCLCDCFANTINNPNQCPNCNGCNNMTITPSEYYLYVDNNNNRGLIITTIIVILGYQKLCDWPLCSPNNYY